MDAITTTDLLATPLASLAAASVLVKTLISLAKLFQNGTDHPSTLTPLALRLAAVGLGVFCALALGIGPLALPDGAAAVYVYGNRVLGGLMVAAGALGTHEAIDMAKREKR